MPGLGDSAPVHHLLSSAALGRGGRCGSHAFGENVALPGLPQGRPAGPHGWVFIPAPRRGPSAGCPGKAWPWGAVRDHVLPRWQQATPEGAQEAQTRVSCGLCAPKGPAWNAFPASFRGHSRSLSRFSSERPARDSCSHEAPGALSTPGNCTSVYVCPRACALHVGRGPDGPSSTHGHAWQLRVTAVCRVHALAPWSL